MEVNMKLPRFLDDEPTIIEERPLHEASLAEDPLEPIARTPWYLQYEMLGLLAFLATTVGTIAYLASK